MVTNSALIVFREGLEAVLILAAITASFVGVRRRLRRPVLIGALGGLLVSVLTWVLAQTLLQSLQQYGEKLEAVVGLIAIAVLLLIMNWFFHRVYWSEWIGRFHRRRRELLADERRGFFSAQVLGLALLGLTSVYREGFETVLFLQSLELSAGTVTVLEGAGLGLAATFARRRLHVRPPAQAALQEDADRHRRAARLRARRHGRADRAHDAGHGLAADHARARRRARTGPGCGSASSRRGRRSARRSSPSSFVIGSYFLAQEVKVKRPRAARGRPEARADPRTRARRGLRRSRPERVGEGRESRSTEVERCV